ncbi:hypothetical protein PC116_g11175 [Phytophthora cactorum]|uniref:Uncharacterized protein n=1 Tax=Phytophthora cactorum TaxID=29920 RepID=A0A8T1KVP1_9STRA|nr:hypothetical protein PC114_g17828 [Phytophthora cactorum]KAG2917683.1 hypothetical protein PC117_g17352 [Phytophthora cactorum]KAG2999406.1 hypothetical protein PC119_g17222 [Phytophthora cactorum]KAG3007798.1 hypothetical protein PC120_g16625 [Phytophthora cactorum]KAG3176243.1 hypothetical protein C6341_g9060 [Phytophthora cactorum]
MDAKRGEKVTNNVKYALSIGASIYAMPCIQEKPRSWSPARAAAPQTSQ